MRIYKNRNVRVRIVVGSRRRQEKNNGLGTALGQCRWFVSDEAANPDLDRIKVLITLRHVTGP